MLEFVGFDAGDRLVFSVDVDEVEDFDPQETDVQRDQRRLRSDHIGRGVSGIDADGDAGRPALRHGGHRRQFLNRYDPELEGTDLDLPADDFGGKRDRSAGAVGDVCSSRRSLPASAAMSITIATRTADVMRVKRDLADVAIEAIPLQTVVEQARADRSTDASGDYEFPSLMPGSLSAG